MRESAIGWISEVVLDGPDPWVLARFWAGLPGGTPVAWYPGWVTLEPPPNGQRLSFQATATPLDPDTARVHFDILLSEVRRADVLANDPCTREFLQAGERLLHDILARDTGEVSGRARAPFYEVLACVSRRQVVDEAEGSWTGQGGTAGKPTESAFRYRWNTQTGFLRDLAIYSLRSRLTSSGQSGKAASFLFGNDTDAGSGAFDEKIDQIAYREVLNLKNDKAFRLQMIFQAILAHDDQVANALRRVDNAHVEAWKSFYADAFGRLGLRLRPDVSFDDLAHALNAAGEGVVFRALLPETKQVPPSARPLD
ncbi:MAG TPA: VOC family protein, partial [Streptosporangiaceae bacterium]